MGIIHYRRIEDYWVKSWPFGTNTFSRVMTRDRFSVIVRFLQSMVSICSTCTHIYNDLLTCCCIPSRQMPKKVKGSWLKRVAGVVYLLKAE